MSIVFRRTRAACVVGLVAAATTLLWNPLDAAAATTDIRINEVESNLGSPGDWVELTNVGTTTVDLGGLKFLDNDNTHTAYVIPAATMLAPGALYVMEEAQFVFGLGSADSARLFASNGTTLIDSYSWTAHASTTYGRCPDGTGAFTTTVASTKGSANNCGTPATTTTVASGATAWPGDAAVAVADVANTFGGNLSGLTYDGSGGATPGVLWGVRNGPSSLFRLVRSGSTWVPDTGDWTAGKALRYPDGTGDPDAEGVTFGGPTSASGIFVSTERNNSINGTSRNSILQFDPSTAGSTISATHEWNLTADLPVTGPNLGMEAITWIPDSFLVAHSLLDETTGQPYDPAIYANHGAGLFFVGLEANGAIYAYALNLAGTSFTRVATFTSGFVSVMDLTFDADLGDLWAVCDDGCLGRTATLDVSTATKKFAVTHLYDRPTGMPNINNEGFTITSATECVANRKPVYWADDSETDGHSIRSGNIPCTSTTPPADVPEFPLPALAAVLAIVGLGGVTLVRRRSA